MFAISTTIFEVLWDELRLPPMPARITIAQHGATLTDRVRIRDAALAEAQRLGLGRPPHLDRRLTDLLGVLARHERAVSLRELAGHRRRAYAAAGGRHGAMGVIHRERVSVHAIPGDHLARELLAMLPDLPAGPGSAVSVPSTAFDAAMPAYTDARDSAEARRILHDAGVGGRDLERLLTIARDTVNCGSIGVHKREHNNAKFVGSLGYADTSRGRYAIVRRDDRAGRSYTTVIPTDIDGLHKRLQRLLGVDAGW